MSDELQDRINSLLGGGTSPADPPGGEKEADPRDNLAQAMSDQVMMDQDDMDAEDIETEELKKKNLNLILDIPLEVSVELGRNKMLIQDLLQLGQGSVIELNKLAGEPLEVLVNGRLVARGEVVVIHDKFGVRLTDIISPNERIHALGG